MSRSDRTRQESGYAEPGYVDDRYAEPGYADDRYAEPGYADDRYVDDRYAEPGYADDGYADDRYADDRYGEPGYADDGYADDRYADDRYADDRYGEPGYADDGYADDRYAESEPGWGSSSDRSGERLAPRRRPVRGPDPGVILDLRRHRMRVRMLKTLWTVTFLLLVFVPLALVPGAGGETRPWSKGGIWVELCMTSGLLGLSTLAATIVLPSRVRSLTQAFGIEGILRSHRWLAVATTVIVVAHVLFIVIDRPLNVLLLSPASTGANRARAGLVATVAMVLLCVLSFRRKRMGTRYDVWRWLHAILAVAALVGTYMHVYWLNHLMQNAAERTAFIAILVGVGAVMINRWIRRPFSSLRYAYTVKEVIQESPTASTLVLSPARPHQRPMQYRPGQFAWIRLDSPFGPLQGNPFTIASGIDNPRELMFTIRNYGDFSSSIATLTPGRRVFVDGPYGSFNDDYTGAGSLLLIAGGVGMSPMMSILRSHAYRGDPRQHVLLKSARTPDELMFAEELEQLAAELDLEVIDVVSKPPSDWQGVSGRVDEELLAEVLQTYDLQAVHAFICGPQQMSESVAEALVNLGVPKRDVHTEEFEMV